MERKALITGEEQLVVFRLGREAYGVDIGQVQGIERMQVVTRVPHAPAFVDGVINLRGQVTPVITLRARLHMEPAEHTRETRIVVVRMGNRGVGMVVDAVEGVMRIAGEQVEPPSELVASTDSAYLRGIAKVNDDLLILLDLEKVLSWREVATLDAAEFSHAAPA
jgi:purine-binding chemotaxis protein CheW